MGHELLDSSKLAGGGEPKFPTRIDDPDELVGVCLPHCEGVLSLVG